jgi:hypothetical protein
MGQLVLWTAMWLELDKGEIRRHHREAFNGSIEIPIFGVLRTSPAPALKALLKLRS